MGPGYIIGPGAFPGSCVLGSEARADLRSSELAEAVASGTGQPWPAPRYPSLRAGTVLHRG